MYGLEKNIILTYLIFCDRKAAIDANVVNSGSLTSWSILSSCLPSYLPGDKANNSVIISNNFQNCMVFFDKEIAFSQSKMLQNMIHYATTSN